MPPTTAYIALGANLGDRLGNLRGAIAALAAVDGVSVIALSGLYETAPVGGPTQQDTFYNAVVRIETTLDPIKLLDLVQTIETAHQRVRDVRWGPRTLDLDVLFYGSKSVGDARLEIPHPRLQDRRFVLAPLADVGADHRHPKLGLTVAQLLAALPKDDVEDVVRIKDAWI